MPTWSSLVCIWTKLIHLRDIRSGQNSWKINQHNTNALTKHFLTARFIFFVYLIFGNTTTVFAHILRSPNKQNDANLGYISIFSLHLCTTQSLNSKCVFHNTTLSVKHCETTHNRIYNEAISVFIGFSFETTIVFGYMKTQYTIGLLYFFSVR